MECKHVFKNNVCRYQTLTIENISLWNFVKFSAANFNEFLVEQSLLLFVALFSCNKTSHRNTRASNRQIININEHFNKHTSTLIIFCVKELETCYYFSFILF